MTQPTIYAVTGLPGVGKSTVANEIAQDRSLRIIRTDHVRQTIHRQPTYTEKETARVYDSVAFRVKEMVRRDRSVVVDGTFRKREHRNRLRTIATKHNATLRFYKVICDPTVVKQRLEKRENDISDANYSVYENLEFEPYIDTADPTIIDTSTT